MASALVPTRAVFQSPVEGNNLRQVREGVAMSKIERLAGISGEPVAELLYGNVWCVAQIPRKDPSIGVYGPARKDEQSAIRAWNAMVRRIRKANAGVSK